MVQPDRREPAPAPAAKTSAPTWRQRLEAGGWYFAVTIFTAGFLAAVPFWHAAVRLRTSRARQLAAVFTLADLYLVVLLILTPPRNPDGSSGNEAISSLGGFSVIAIVVIACILLRPIRREVYGGKGVITAHEDPAVARALAARARRDEARQLFDGDPSLARELGIGRPDLGRDYDDGGLVDINTAPAEVIVRVCGIDRVYADALVAARARRGGAWFNLGEVLVDLDLPPYVQEQLREHAVL
jgi:hypothetical protein